MSCDCCGKSKFKWKIGRFFKTICKNWKPRKWWLLEPEGYIDLGTNRKVHVLETCWNWLWFEWREYRVCEVDPLAAIHLSDKDKMESRKYEASFIPWYRPKGINKNDKPLIKFVNECESQIENKKDLS